MIELQQQLSRKAILIAVHFGNFPAWINLTLETFIRNQDFDLLLVTDQKTDKLLTGLNIKFCHYTLENFGILASQKTHTQVNVKKGYKVCDLRPAFAAIFDTYIEGYQYWGHIDLDTFWGDMSSVLDEPISQAYDIICGASYHVGGPFCLYRNTEKINKLYRENPFYKHAFASESNVDFDEIGIQINNQGFETTVRECERQENIKVFRSGQLYLQDVDSSWWVEQVKKAYPDDDRMLYPTFESGVGVWRDGKIFAFTENKEYMFYHLLDGKRRLFRPFYIKWCNQIQYFTVGVDGIKLDYKSLLYKLLHQIEQAAIEVMRILIYDLGSLRHKLGLYRRG